MIFSDIFPVSYATFCGVQLGESFVSRPANIGAGEWIYFWEYVFDDPGRLTVAEYETEIASANAEIKHLENQLEEKDEEIDSYISENEDLRAENRDYDRRIDELEELVAKLREDCDRMDYEMGRP